MRGLRLWGVGCLAASVFASCSNSAENETARSIDSEIVSVADSDCNDDGDTYEYVRVQPAQKPNRLHPDGITEVSIINLHTHTCSVTPVIDVFSRQHVEKLHLDPLLLAPDEERRLQVDLNALSIPVEEMAFSGRLNVNASVRCADGENGYSLDKFEAYFHSENGTWVVYDRTYRDLHLDGGALTDQARSLKKSVEAEGRDPESAGDVHVSEGALIPDDGYPDPDSWGPQEEQHALAEGLLEGAGGGGEFCFDVETNFIDGGVGEDFWPTNGKYYRDARGIAAIITKGGTTYFSGYAGDGIGAGDPGLGCTGPVLTDSGTYTVTLYTLGQANGHFVQSYDETNGSQAFFSGASSQTFTQFNDGVSTDHLDVDISSGSGRERAFRAFMLGTYAVWRHGGGFQPAILYIKSNSSGGSSYSTTLQRIELRTEHDQEKFRTVHEIGHWISDYGMDEQLNGMNYSATASDADCDESNTTHSMTSRENQKAAAGEGWAHFYAADVFNDHSETDCSFEYYKTIDSDSTPLVNCSVGNGHFVNRFLEQRCNSDSDVGHGTELDYLRTFWQMHAVLSGTKPTFTQMVQMIDGANSISNSDAFEEMWCESDDLGSPEDKFKTAADERGSDQCASSPAECTPSCPP